MPQNANVANPDEVELMFPQNVPSKENLPNRQISSFRQTHTQAQNHSLPFLHVYLCVNKTLAISKSFSPTLF